MFVIRVGLFLNEMIKCDLFYFSLSLSLKKLFFICVAYFNHAANILKYFDKLLKKKKKKVTLNHLTDWINRSKFLSVG